MLKRKNSFYMVVLSTSLMVLLPLLVSSQPDNNNWCDRVAGGAHGTLPPAIDLSLAHAQIRFFSPENQYSQVDQALVQAMPLEGTLAEALSTDLLSTYANALESVCRVQADDRTLPEAHVEIIGNVAVIHPGSGVIALPEQVQAVAIDLTDLPDSADVAEALRNALSAAIVTPATLPNMHVRQHNGLTDEVFSENNVYANSVIELSQEPIQPQGKQELPLAFLTGHRMPAYAALIAGALRIDKRAVIIGKEILAAVAESRFHGIGAQGLSYRTTDLYSQRKRWSDVIEPDLATDNPLAHLSQIQTLYPPSALGRPVVTRALIEAVNPFGDTQPAATTLKEVRSALIVVHGTLRLFFPYFATVGDHIDSRLLETIETAENTQVFDTFSFYNLLRRFGESIKDGHQFVFNFGTSTVIGYLPIFVEKINNEPVIRRSLATGINPGDTIISIDGQSASQWYEQEYTRTAGATPGYQFDLATRQLIAMQAPTELGLRALDGSTRTLLANPYPFEVYVALGFAPSLRQAGFLADLGAPDIYYINLDGEVLARGREFSQYLREAQSAAGLVLDMRGYPGINHYEVAARINCSVSHSPIFRVPVWKGPDQLEVNESQYTIRPRQHPSYCGPVALLVGPITVSAAENFSTILVDVGRVTVVGRQSAGTNGNITGVQVPGAFGFSFTGMEVLHNDRSTFHGIGILPDVEVGPQAADFPSGLDRELMKAIEVLQQ